LKKSIYKILMIELIIGPFTPQPTKDALVNTQTMIRTIFILHIMGNNAHKCTILD
jgi:hypothetical protein